MNTANYEYNALVSPDDSFLIFTTHGRGIGLGSADLWISFRHNDGSWSTPKNMGEKVNTNGFEFCPSLSPDGETFFFTRREIPLPPDSQWTYPNMEYSFSSLLNGQGNIYSINASLIQELKDSL